MAATVLDDIRPVAADYGCSWNTCDAAVETTADAVLDGEPASVTVLGIDETAGPRPNARPARIPETHVGGPLRHRPGRHHR